MRTDLKIIQRSMIILFTLLFVAGCGKHGSELSIIPEPLELVVNNSFFKLNENTRIVVDSENPATDINYT